MLKPTAFKTSVSMYLIQKNPKREKKRKYILVFLFTSKSKSKSVISLG